MTDADNDQPTHFKDWLEERADRQGDHNKQQRPQRTLVDLRADAWKWLGLARLAAVIYGIVGVVGAVILAAVMAAHDGDPMDPYVALSIAAGVFALFSAVAVYAVLSYLTWRVADAPA